MKRRLNVQEQNLLSKEGILKVAKYWRMKGFPIALEVVFREKGIDLDTSIILDYEQNYPGRSTDEGILLTEEGIFYEFEADLNPDRTKLIELYAFLDVSNRFEICEHKKGIGKTYGFLAMEVLRELNSL